MSEVTTNPIYHYRASDELGEEAWGMLRDEVAKWKHMDWAWHKDNFRQWESEYKKSTGLPLPGAYRSAKSVLKNAILYGLPFEGAGKTAVEKLIQGRKAADKEVVTPFEKAVEMADKLREFGRRNNIEINIVITNIGE